MNKHLFGFIIIAISTASTICMESEQQQLTNEEKRFLVTRCAQRLQGHTHIVNAVACRPDGKQIASGSADKTVKLWSPNNHNALLYKTLDDHTNSVYCVTYNPQGPHLASGGVTNKLRGIIMIHDSRTNELLHTIHDKSQIRAITYNYDGSHIASASNPGPFIIKVWDVQQGTLIETLEGHENSVRSIVSHSHSPQIATGSDDTTAKLWDTRTATCITTLAGDKYPVLALTYNADGTNLITTSLNGLVKLWDLRTNKPLTTMHLVRNYIQSVACNPHDSSGIALGLDGAIRLQNLYHEGSHTFLRNPKEQCCGYSVNSLAYSPDGAQLVAGLGSHLDLSPQAVDVWDMKLVKKINDEAFNSKEIKMLQKYTKSIYSLSFSEIDQLTEMGFDVTLRQSDMIY